MNKIYMTKKTYQTLQKRLHYLTTDKAKELKKVLKEAKSGGGGMHDNAGYENALMQERMLAKQIQELLGKLKDSEVVFIDDLPTDITKVCLGTKVRVLVINKHHQEKIREYSILGPDDSDPEKNVISYLSPIGKELIGKKIGDEAEINLSNGRFVFKILEISRANFNEGGE